MLDICNKCKWKGIQEPNKCQTCKHNMLEKQDYYEKNDRELREQQKKTLDNKGQNYKKKTFCCMRGENDKFCGKIEGHTGEHKYYTEEELREAS